jgi:UDP-N-acetyl-D-glucosamine dehydrogenase
MAGFSIRSLPVTGASALIERIESREAVIGIVGLGYVGLPLAMTFCRGGFRVIGYDIDPRKVEALNRGESYIGHIPAQEVAGLRQGGRFEATDDFARASEADALLICVPTPLTEHQEPDLSYITNTARALAPNVRRGQLIVLESTTYPGTTEEVLQPVLEESGLVAGDDFLLAYSPEREDPGNAHFSTGKIPKVVGGCTPEALDAADALYRQIVVSTVRVSNARTAEAVKLLENVFRAVNIALVNELKLIYTKMGIDIWEVIEAAKTKPFGFMPFYPGPGLGGHCIPIDPFYLTWKAREYGVTTRFIELAGEINTAMPQYVVSELMDVLNDHGHALKGARVLVLGVAYKPDVGDPRESPGLTLIEMLQDRGAVVEYNDPYVPTLVPTRKHRLKMDSIALTAKSIAGYDAVLIVTAHGNYDYDFIVENARLVLDTRNATKDVTRHREKIFKA